MAREPFNRTQLEYIERTALRTMHVWARALEHLDRIGASEHPLYGVIRDAHHADHALRVQSMYAKLDAERSRENRR